MTKRRGHGEGSLYQRKSDGRWVAQLDLGWRDGRRRRKAIYGKSQAEVIEKLQAARQTLSGGIELPDSRITTGAFLDSWVKDILPGRSVKPTTAAEYEQIVARYIKPHVGHIKLAGLRPSDVHRMQAALREKGLAPRTIRYARAVLSSALTHAERWNLVARNPVKLVDPPAAGRAKTDDALTLDEARRLLDSIKGHRLEALVTVALAVGLRKGEALALRWEDVDFDARTVTVRGTLKRRSGGGLYVDSVKTDSSRATIPLPLACVTALEAHRRRQAEERLAAGPAWSDLGFVFTTKVGSPIDGGNALREFRSMTDKAGLGKRRFHALRHSAATLMWEQGVPLEVISSTLRHSGLSITKDIYLTFRPEVLRTGADAMDAVLSPPASGF